MEGDQTELRLEEDEDPAGVVCLRLRRLKRGVGEPLNVTVLVNSLLDDASGSTCQVLSTRICKIAARHIGHSFS